MQHNMVKKRGKEKEKNRNKNCVNRLKTHIFGYKLSKDNIVLGEKEMLYYNASVMFVTKTSSKTPNHCNQSAPSMIQCHQSALKT